MAALALGLKAEAGPNGRDLTKGEIDDMWRN
jgi:hypothetical protein